MLEMRPTFVKYILLFLLILVSISYLSLPIRNGNKDDLYPNVLNLTITNQFQRTFYPHIAVLIEFRTEDMMITVVHNILSHIPPSWPIQIFHGKDNEEFIRNSTLAPIIRTGRILFTRLESPVLKSNISILLTSRSFWTQVRGEKVLFFQIDSMMCSNSPHRVTDFLQYDYVGAPWDTSWFGYDHRYLVGNGGFSLRTRSKILALIETLPYDGQTPEDVWYAANLHRVNALIPSTDIAKRFAVESVLYPRPVGIHRFPLNCLSRKDLIQTCPEAALVMTHPCR